MRSVCVGCNYRQEGQQRNCPKCGWMMIDGPLPKVGSLPVPRKPFSFRRIANQLVAPALCVGVVSVLGVISAVVDANTLPPPAPAPVIALSTPAPIATPALTLAAASVSQPIAKPVVKKKAAPVAKKKPVAKKTAAKKKATTKKVARR